ncbi:hypothetical protein D9M71_519630 [compost metagenome]
MAELAAEVAAFGRAAVAVVGEVDVLRHHHAFLVIAAEQVQRLGMAEYRRLLVERDGAGFVLRHAAPGGMQVGEVVHGPVEPRVGGDAVVPGRFRGVGGTAPAVLQTAPEHVARHGVAALGGDTEPHQRQRRIAFDALAVEEDLAEQRLRFQFALACGLEDQVRGQARVAGHFVGRQFFRPAQIESHTSTQRRSRL